MKSDGVDVDFNVLTQGLEDAISQKEPRLKDEEMRKLIVDLRKRAREAQQRKFQEQIVSNRGIRAVPRGEQEEEGVKVTESGLQYRVLKQGDGATPAEDWASTPGHVHDGKEFDSSYAKGEPAESRPTASSRAGPRPCR
jgi:FKBP-type peptidyl-prolyl cis-trans isomerase FklB